MARLAKLMEQRPVLRVIALRFRPLLGLLLEPGVVRPRERAFLTCGEVTDGRQILVGGAAGLGISGRLLTAGRQIARRGFPSRREVLSGTFTAKGAVRKGGGLRDLAGVFLSADLDGGRSLYGLFIRDHSFLSGHKFLLLLFGFC